MSKNKTTEALLVIVVGLLILYLIKGHDYFLYFALGAGVIGIIIKPLAVLIAKGWYKLGEILGYIVSKLVLTILFYFLLVPIALLHNLFNKDSLRLKRTQKTLWFERNHKYTSDDLKNIW